MKRSRQVLVLVLMLLGFLLGSIGISTLVIDWLREPAELLSVDNVKAEYEWFYNKRRGLDALALSMQSVKQQLASTELVYGSDTLRWPLAAREEYMQLSKIRTQQETAYNMSCAEYQARWDNIFHSLVAPKDIPRGCRK